MSERTTLNYYNRVWPGLLDWNQKDTRARALKHARVHIRTHARTHAPYPFGFGRFSGVRRRPSRWTLMNSTCCFQYETNSGWNKQRRSSDTRDASATCRRWGVTRSSSYLKVRAIPKNATIPLGARYRRATDFGRVSGWPITAVVRFCYNIRRCWCDKHSVGSKYLDLGCRPSYRFGSEGAPIGTRPGDRCTCLRARAMHESVSLCAVARCTCVSIIALKRRDEKTTTSFKFEHVEVDFVCWGWLERRGGDGVGCVPWGWKGATDRRERADNVQREACWLDVCILV